MNYEYVFSGLNFTGLIPRNDSVSKEIAPIIYQCICKLQESINQNNLKMSVLFNAFQEKHFGKWQRECNLYGFKRQFADSGGLQIITRGLSITEDIKTKIYDIQSIADVAMCFDEIPLKNIRKETSSRTQTKDKMYIPSIADDCARLTAENIKKQIKFFRDHDCNTKVSYIIQGNNSDDMVKWFRHGCDILNHDDWEYISGLSLANICIGNGLQESVEMCVAYHRIRNEFSEFYTKNNVHLLGIGSIKRIIPFIQLSRKGFLPECVNLSFDSSSLSMAIVMGNYTFDCDTDFAIKHTMIPSLSKSNVVKPDIMWLNLIIKEVMEYYQDILDESFPNANKNEIIEHLITNRRFIARMEQGLDGDSYLYKRTIIPLIIIHQILLFSKKLQQIITGSMIDVNYSDKTPLFGLGLVKTLKDYNNWLNNNYGWMNNSNTRIARENRNLVDLDSFFI